MAQSRNFIEYASAAAGTLNGFASIPSGADNAIIRVESGTVRWSESTGSWLTASIGLVMSGVDPPIRINGLSAFRFIAVGGAGSMQALYYSYQGIGDFL